MYMAVVTPNVQLFFHIHSTNGEQSQSGMEKRDMNVENENKHTTLKFK